jgi:hypothetical protein
MAPGGATSHMLNVAIVAHCSYYSVEDGREHVVILRLPLASADLTSAPSGFASTLLRHLLTQH